MVTRNCIGKPPFQFFRLDVRRQGGNGVLQRINDGIEFVNILLNKMIVDGALDHPAKGKEHDRYNHSYRDGEPYY